MSVEIYIARHGQNEDNVNGILNGHRDLPLTDLGRAQAGELAQGIKDAKLEFTSIYSSPLKRAHETALIVRDLLNLDIEPIIMPELIERDFGIMTGVPINQVEDRCKPDILKTNTITYFLNPEGAETFPELVERGHEVLDNVRSQQKEGNSLLVCHGDIGKMVYAAATGKYWRDVLANFHFGNCDLIEVGPNDEAHKVKLEQHNH